MSLASEFAGAGATSEGAAAARRSLAAKPGHRLIGVLLGLALAMVTLLLVVVDNSPIVPGLVGGGTNYEPGMVFYLFLLTAVAFPAIGFAPSVHTNRTAVNLASGGSLTRFGMSYGTTGFLAWLVLGLAGMALGVVYVPLSGADRLGVLVFDAVFVSAVEEVTFRLALPLVMNPWVSTSILFPLAHLPLDVAIYGTNVELLAAAFLQRAIAGAVLWLIYSRVNLAAAMAAHMTYDAYLQGGLPMGAPLGLVHLGLVPV